MQALRATTKADVGIVLNYEKADPASDTPAAREAAATWHALYNQWYVGGAIKGEYPERMTTALAEYLPNGWEGEMSTVAQPIDFLGVNYYTRARMDAAAGPEENKQHAHASVSAQVKRDNDVARHLARLPAHPARVEHEY